MIAGVSVGALVASVLAMYPHSEVQDALAHLERLFSDVKNRDVWKRWPLGWFSALWKPSLYNSKPLEEWVLRELDVDKVRRSGKELRVGAVSLTTGKYKIFDQQYPQLTRAVVASASFPGAFLPVELDGELWTDGGARNVTPLGAAIAAGCDEVDVVICEPAEIPPKVFGSVTAPKVLARTVRIMINEAQNDDLRFCQLHNEMSATGCSDRRHVDVRVIRPLDELNDNPLNFSPEEAVRIRAIGYSDARRIAAPPAKSGVHAARTRSSMPPEKKTSEG